MEQVMKPTRNADSAQPALFTAVRWPRAQTPKRETVLNVLETLVQWEEIETALRPHYQADTRKTGRKGYSLKMMVRTFALQLLWDMSDRQAEAAILDSHLMSRFIGSDPWQPRPPSASSLRQFRNLLARIPAADHLDMLDDWLAATIRASLHASGIEFRPGQIRDPVFRRIPNGA